MPAGYSGTPLVRKLGLEPDTRVLFVGAPEHLPALLGPLPPGIHLLGRAASDLDYVHLFVRTQAELNRRLPSLAQRIAPTGALWVSWPKKTSPLAQDLTGNEVRAAGLQAGLVDVKVCAVDDDWSGHKFVVRTSDRPKRAR